MRNTISLLVPHLWRNHFSCVSCLTPQQSRQNVGDVLRQRPKIWERPKSPLGFFRSVIYGESSPKFQMYNEQKANGALTRENKNANNKSVEKAWKHNKSEISTHSHPEEEIERGCEEEREGSAIPIFSPLRFGIVRLLTGWMGFCSEVSSFLGRTSPLFWIWLGPFVLNLGCSKWLVFGQ